MIKLDVSPRGGGTPDDDLYGEALAERVGISLVEVYEREEKSVSLVIKRANMHSIAVEKLRNRFGFVIYSYLKDGAFAAVTRASEF